jgi:hypothetical protein
MGFKLALERLDREPTCRALFGELGADARDMLGRSVYHRATPELERFNCASADAVTRVGSTVTWVCSRLAQESREQAALILIHEALHFAGLPESPPTPGAMSSKEINDRIADRCGL